MTKLVLPHTIDAGTDIVAVEHQDNYVAIRDNMNGLLEGGDPAVNGNMAANGITSRELAHNLMKYHTRGPIKQEGVFTEGELKVSPSANMILAVAAGEAMITDDTGLVFDVGMKVPVKYAGDTIALDAAHATLPRVDQIVARITAYETVTVEKLTGTATAGAQISVTTGASYRAGATALGNDRIRLADVLVPATDTVISADQINDRRPWCRGEMTFTLSAIASLKIFSDLAGVTDMGYECWLSAQHSTATDYPYALLQLNGDSSANYLHEYHYQDQGGAVAASIGGTRLGITIAGGVLHAADSGLMVSHGVLYGGSSTAQRKTWIGQNYQTTSTMALRRHGNDSSYWNNTTEDITLIDLRLGPGTPGTLTGKFTIRKLQTAI